MNFQRQADGYSCGAVSVLNAIAALGGAAEIDHIKRLAGTNTKGTSEAGILRALRALGYRATAYRSHSEDAAWKWLNKYLDQPIILSVDAHRHWLTIYGTHTERVLAIDSGSDAMSKNDMGLFLYNKAELLARWRSAWGLVAVRVDLD